MKTHRYKHFIHCPECMDKQIKKIKVFSNKNYMKPFKIAVHPKTYKFLKREKVPCIVCKDPNSQFRITHKLRICTKLL
jgi:hypothetical protein